MNSRPGPSLSDEVLTFSKPLGYAPLASSRLKFQMYFALALLLASCWFLLATLQPSSLSSWHFLIRSGMRLLLAMVRTTQGFAFWPYIKTMGIYMTNYHLQRR